MLLSYQCGIATTTQPPEYDREVHYLEDVIG